MYRTHTLHIHTPHQVYHTHTTYTTYIHPTPNTQTYIPHSTYTHSIYVAHTHTHSTYTYTPYHAYHAHIYHIYMLHTLHTHIPHHTFNTHTLVRAHAHTYTRTIPFFPLVSPWLPLSSLFSQCKCSPNVMKASLGQVPLLAVYTIVPLAHASKPLCKCSIKLQSMSV